MQLRLIALTAALAAPAAASATLVTALPLEQLAAESDLVVFGDVVTTEPFIADDGRVYTRVTILPTDGSDEVVVLQLGGRSGDLVTRVPGADLYTEGESVVVFLEEIEDDTFQSISLSFSKFTVDSAAGSAVRDVEYASLAPALTGPPLPPAALAWFPQRVPLGELARAAELAPRVVGLPLSVP